MAARMGVKSRVVGLDNMSRAHEEAEALPGGRQAIMDRAVYRRNSG